MKRNLVTWLDKKVYPGFAANWDNTIFREMVLTYISKEKILLDVGAGRGALPQMNFKGLVAKVCGVDPEDAVLGNPYLDAAFVGFANNMPFFENEQFDIVTSNNVLEHIEKPESFLFEVSRVLKPGGVLIAKTPNKLHYMPVLATMLPDSLHNYYHKLKGRPAIDTFPTFYRMNSRKMIKKLARENGFEVEQIRMIEGRPEYLRINFLSYMVGIAYERLVNLFRMQDLKIVMFIVLKKKHEADRSGS
ncbi:MAG: class I SAM-dependent methyltransferase [Bacteroidota bacterium]